MREIKFRAWHKGQMLMQPINTPFAASRLFGFLDAVGVHTFDDVMQFTGLHDKNGKEIFEGDILGLNGINTSVVFHEASFCMDSQSENRMPSPLHGDRTRMYTVVGNIYENPQLLEGG
jgi:uncharacterized phage protein (TIGR01671 family)